MWRDMLHQRTNVEYAARRYRRRWVVPPFLLKETSVESRRLDDRVYSFATLGALRRWLHIQAALTLAARQLVTAVETERVFAANG
jgi:hypothetical protein